jgi:hypothetical protein
MRNCFLKIEKVERTSFSFLFICNLILNADKGALTWNTNVIAQSVQVNESWVHYMDVITIIMITIRTAANDFHPSYVTTKIRKLWGVILCFVSVCSPQVHLKTMIAEWPMMRWSRCHWQTSPYHQNEMLNWFFPM